MKTNRRSFIRQVTLGGAALCLTPLDAISMANSIKLTVLHTNDVHSHIDPFPESDPRNGGMGGVAQRGALINKIRASEEHVLLLDAGDIFQGTPYFNIYGGELEFKLMSEMKYDAATIGNHDFDNGMEGLLKQMPHASFPFICSNYDFRGTVLEGKTLPYKIFEKGPLRIGVFGLGIELEGLVDKKLFGETKYLDPLEKAAEFSYLLKVEKKCDLVICLSHLGYKYRDEKVSDLVLAKSSRNIDLIVGGHTHTFLDEPLVYTNRAGQDVMIAQVGWGGIKLGRIDFFLQKKSGQKSSSGTALKISKNPNRI